jgi:hypothetical protein
VGKDGTDNSSICRDIWREDALRFCLGMTMTLDK